MIPKGASNIKGIHSINTKPGPITESSGLLRLYLLAAEKTNLVKRLEWVKRQKEQMERRLLEVVHAMNLVKKVVEDKTKNQQSSPNPNSRFRNMHIRY